MGKPDLKKLKEKKINKSTNYTGDLNEINDTCFYYASSATNVPEGTGNGYVFTQKMSNSYMVQYFERRGYNVTYKRFKENGDWGAWIRIEALKITTGVEFKTGRIIDGKEEYGKRLAISALPNKTYITINSGVIGAKLTDGGIKGSFSGTTVDRTYPEGTYREGVSMGINMYYNRMDGQITLTCQADGSNYSGHITLYYTKN